MAALLTSKNVFALTALAALIILLAYDSAKNTIDRAAPAIFWAIVGVIGVLATIGLVAFAVTQIEKLYTLRTQMKSARSIAQADADKAQNEANAPLVITAAMNERLVIRDPDPNSYYRQLHLDPRTHVNGHHQEATAQEVQTYMAISNGYTGQRDAGQLVIDQQSVMSGTIQPENILDRYNSDWIQSLVMPSPHIHYCGATTSGKTRLANYHIAKIAEQNPDARIYLINPKHVESIGSFVVEPNFKGIGEALAGLMAFNAILETRVADKSFDQATSNGIIFIIDEWDWIFHRYGNEAVDAFEPLVKTGAAIKVNVILIGQSPLTGDTGLSQSFYNNMTRVAIWKEGGKLLNNYPLERKYKAPLQAQYEELKLLASQTDTENNKLRYCVVAPMSGNPSVQVIPYLEDPVSPGKAPKATKRAPIKDSYDERVCKVWYNLSLQDHKSANKMHHVLTGNTVNINQRQKEKYVSILAKYGLPAGFLEKSN